MANDFIMMDSSNESNKEEHAGTTYTSQENHTGMGAGQQYHRYYQMGGDSGPAGKPPFKKKNSGNGVGKKVMAVIAGGLVFGLVAGVAFQGVNLAGNYFFDQGNSNQQVGTVGMVPSLEEQSEAKSDGDTDSGSSSVVPMATTTVADVAKNTMPSVVAITSISVQEIPTFDFFGWGGGGTQQYEGESSGSGIIVGENENELLIATNNHVVDGAKTLSVCFQDKKKEQGAENVQNTSEDNQGGADTENAVAAQIKGTDAENDLAVIAVKKADIPEETLGEIKIAQLGSSNDLVVGEQVVAIGNALGFGQSVTSGYVSALDRYVDNMTTPCIQTDAAINPGNSGGALLNKNGEVIGINSSKYNDTAVEGMGFAIPSNTAKPIIEDLITKEQVSDDKAAYLGIHGENVTAAVTEACNMPEGVFVKEVFKGTAAEQYGIKAGDIITSLDGRDIATMEVLHTRLSYYEAGSQVEIIVQRPMQNGYEEVKLSVVLGKKN